MFDYLRQFSFHCPIPVDQLRRNPHLPDYTEQVINACPECDRLIACYQVCIFEAHDLRNRSLVLEATKASNRLEHTQRIRDVETRVADLKRELSEHEQREHVKNCRRDRDPIE